MARLEARTSRTLSRLAFLNGHSRERRRIVSAIAHTTLRPYFDQQIHLPVGLHAPSRFRRATLLLDDGIHHLSLRGHDPLRWYLDDGFTVVPIAPQDLLTYRVLACYATS